MTSIVQFAGNWHSDSLSGFRTFLAVDLDLNFVFCAYAWVVVVEGGGVVHTALGFVQMEINRTWGVFFFLVGGGGIPLVREA